jgi:hypothetical protein
MCIDSGTPTVIEGGMEIELRGACAQHPARRAAITCRYCGGYACSECTVDTLWGQTLCTACEQRGAARFPVPWDLSPGLGTFVATCRAVFTDLRLMFPNLPDGSVSRALGFASLVWVLLFVIDLLVHAIRSRTIESELWIKGALLGLLYMAWVLAAGASFHVGQKALRGRATLTVCLRASAYLTGLGTLPIIARLGPGIVFFLVALGSAALWLWGLMLFGSGRAGLSRNRAIVATGVALLGSLLAGFVLLLLVAAVVIALEGDLE